MRSLRYQRSCVFVVNGAAQSWSLYSAVRSGPSSLPSRAESAQSPSHGRIQPASANSAVPDHVHADDVDVLVLGSEAARDQLPLLVGIRREPVVLERVASVRLFRAIVERLFEGAARLVEGVEGDRRAASYALVLFEAAACDCKCCGDQARRHRGGCTTPLHPTGSGFQGTSLLTPTQCVWRLAAISSLRPLDHSACGVQSSGVRGASLPIAVAARVRPVLHPERLRPGR